jgi:hypothetical protein
MKTTLTRLASSLSAGDSPAFAALRVSSTRLLTVLLLLGLGASLGLSERAAAQVPERFSFQGYMEDGNGQPLGPTTPVNYTVDFRIYSAATAGALLWAERQIVTFDKGNYSVILGQGSQVSASEPHGDLSAVVINATGSELFVETTVSINGSPATINPRLRLLPAMYSFVAKKALSVDGVAITTGSITEDRLSSSLVSTINNGAIADSRLSIGLRNYITNGPINDAQISLGLRTYITNGASGAVLDSRLSANVARRDTPNTFTGDQTINGRLTNNATVMRSGANAYSAVGTLGDTRIVAGRLPALHNTSAAMATSGTGWTASRLLNQPYWTVAFTPAFAGTPNITTSWSRNSASFQGGATGGAIVSINGGGSFIVYGATFGDNSTPLDTQFIAIGPR